MGRTVSNPLHQWAACSAWSSEDDPAGCGLELTHFTKPYPVKREFEMALDERREPDEQAASGGAGSEGQFFYWLEDGGVRALQVMPCGLSVASRIVFCTSSGVVPVVVMENASGADDNDQKETR